MMANDDTSGALIVWLLAANVIGAGGDWLRRLAVGGEESGEGARG